MKMMIIRYGNPHAALLKNAPSKGVERYFAKIHILASRSDSAHEPWIRRLFGHWYLPSELLNS
jgi:hypothetical protein